LALKENKPIWFCKLVVSRPLSVFGMLLWDYVFVEVIKKKFRPQ
jgi:hypothetical protein